MDKGKGAVLVTGGAGYIGSHTCKALKRAGYNPVSYDNMVYGHEWAVKWGPLEVGDILDRERLDRVLENYQIDAVLHFAAFAQVAESVADPYKYYYNNVVGSLVLLDAMVRHQIKKFVFSSSCATYGIPDKLVVDEETPQKPINPYGASKLMIERMLPDFEVAHGLNWISLRYFNASGADPAGEIGRANANETLLIPVVLDAILGVRPNVSVFGTNFNTPDGTGIRDYIHVTDLAEAHVLALGALENGKASCAYNLGNGVGYSVREVIDASERVTGKKVPVVYAERRVGDPGMLVADATRAKRDLSWAPKIGDIDEIVRTAWIWQSRYAATR